MFIEQKLSLKSAVKISIIDKPIFEGSETYLVHQCNCITQNTAGLATALFNRYPYANTYKNRKRGDDVPGTIKIMGDGTTDKRFIVKIIHLDPLHMKQKK